MWERRVWSLLPEAREKRAMRWRGYKDKEKTLDSRSGSGMTESMSLFLPGSVQSH